MFRNYCTTAIRNLWRNRQFSFINIAGLALGMAVFLLIAQFVAAEWNANRFNEHYHDMYRVNYQNKEGNTEYYLSPGLAPVAKQQIPAIREIVRVATNIANGVITYTASDPNDSRVFREDNIAYADGSFFKLFSFPIVSGTASLAKPQTLALSLPMSRKLFGTEQAVGKTLMISNQFGNTPYTVNAVYELPEASDIRADVLLSLHTLESAALRDGNDWADPNGVESGYANIYVLLQPGATAVSVANSLNTFVHNIDPATKDDKLVLQPFSELHLAPGFNYPYQTYGSFTLVFVFSCVAVLIMLIAWVNYINLSTAQAINRAKEVGVRKVLGANRMQLVMQYLTETLFLTLAAAVIAVLLVNLFQPWFNDFTAKQLSLKVLNFGWFWLAAIVMMIAGSLLSGTYVAFVLTAYKPITAIRGKAQSPVKGFSLRKGLVVFQFSVSVVFIIATVVLYRQLQYMRTEDLGMNIEQLLVIKGPTISSEGQAERNVSFKNSLSNQPFVQQIAASNSIPGLGYNFATEGISRLNNPQQEDQRTSYAMMITDQNFFDTWGIQFKQGSAFSQNDAEASWNNVRKVIINEKAAQALGFKAGEPITGQKILWGEPFEVIGVVKDYHHLSLREPIRPTIYLASVSFSYFTIRTDSRNMQEKIRTIREIYNTTFPGNPFEYFFADESYDRQYTTEQRLGNVFVASALIAVLIACRGLYGLATFSARQRGKEIGIMKVLGAGVGDITALVSKDFIRLVLVAIVIASPIAWYIMHRWLEEFAYRAEISWWIFVTAAVIALSIAFLTISFQAIKAAIANPVNSLRSE